MSLWNKKSQYHTVTAGSFLEMNREKAEILALALIFTLTVSRASMGGGERGEGLAAKVQIGTGETEGPCLQMTQ